MVVRAESRPAPRWVRLRSLLADPSLRFAGALAAASALFWGLGIVAAKGALREGVSPLSLLITQLLASLAVLCAAWITFPRPPISLSINRTSAIAMSGFLEYGLTYSLAAYGLAMTSAGNAALIGALEPTFIVLLAAIYLHERINNQLVILTALAACGLCLVLLPDLRATSTPRAGDMLLLASAAAGAGYAVLSRRFVRTTPPLALSILQQFAALVLIGAVVSICGGWIGFSVAEAAVSLKGIVWAAMSGVLQHGLAVWLHLHALKRMPASSFALYLALVPVVALVTAKVLLGEAITLDQIAGGVLITGAVAWASFALPALCGGVSDEAP